MALEVEQILASERADLVELEGPDPRAAGPERGHVVKARAVVRIDTLIPQPSIRRERIVRAVDGLGHSFGSPLTVPTLAARVGGTLEADPRLAS